MEIVYGESRLIDAQQPIAEVSHDASLTGKGRKTNKLSVNINLGEGGGLAGKGTPSDPLQIVPDGVIVAEDGTYR